MICVYYLETEIVHNVEVVKGIEYIHNAYLGVEGSLRKLIQNTTDAEHTGLIAVAVSWGDATPEEAALCPPPPTAEELYQAQLAAEFNEKHEVVEAALKHWQLVTEAEKDQLLKNILNWSLWKDGWLKLGDI